MIIGYLPVFPPKTSATTRREYYHRAMRLVLKDIESVMKKYASAMLYLCSAQNNLPTYCSEIGLIRQNLVECILLRDPRHMLYNPHGFFLF